MATGLSFTSLSVDAAGGIRTHTKTVLETAASAVGLPRLIGNRLSAPGRIRTCNNVTLIHAPLPFGPPKLKVSQWTPEGFEPSCPGCKPGVLPLDDGPSICEDGSDRIRTCTNLILSQAPLPVGLLNRSFVAGLFAHSCTGPDSNPHLSA
jgi:hypothetical protein